MKDDRIAKSLGLKQDSKDYFVTYAYFVDKLQLAVEDATWLSANVCHLNKCHSWESERMLGTFKDCLWGALYPCNTTYVFKVAYMSENHY